jgi:hypothetical protein
MPVTDDEIVLETGGDPTAITVPTVGASRNVWGSLLNTAVGQIVKAIAYVQGLITALQAADTALDGRIGTLEGAAAQSGFVYGSEVYFWGETCQGFDEELVADTVSYTVAVPFDQIGTFYKIFFKADNGPTTFNLSVRDSVNGRPGTILATASITSTGGIIGWKVLNLNTSVTLTRRAWLTVTGGQVYTRGRTGQTPPLWTLGTPGAIPSAATDVTTCLRLNGSTWQAVALGSNKWAPAIGLVSN